jgi:hypothetical protein
MIMIPVRTRREQTTAWGSAFSAWNKLAAGPFPVVRAFEFIVTPLLQ